MLTKDEMIAAHFARQLDLSPDYEVSGPERARQWSREHSDSELNPTLQDRDEELYRLGKDVLSEYTLSYSERFTVLPPDIPENVVATTRVDAGHIATSPAYRLAMFRRRKSTSPRFIGELAGGVLAKHRILQVCYFSCGKRETRLAKVPRGAV